MTAVWWLIFAALGCFGLGLLGAIAVSAVDGDDGLASGCLGAMLAVAALLLVAAGMTWIWVVAL